MTEKISILHISDLHRTKDGKISNDALLFSLINDRDSYTSEIKAPQLIIVSGDIIQGSTSPTESDKEVKEQYDEAIDFLNNLADKFLDGDKNRIIIVPGNHDIQWKYSQESMEVIKSDEVEKDNLKSQYLRDFKSHNSLIRWSWKDLSFFRITDKVKYNKRLEAFTTFYSTFYDGNKLYSLEPSEQFDIFDFPNFNLTIVGFNSCYSNDHCREAGDIHPDCIAKSGLKLRDYRKAGRLLLAVWHHNTKGSPYEFNYMDNSRLKNFIDSGISLGFHGHQHATEVIHEFSDVIEQNKIIIFSAGTLCAGPNELPTGNNRQYNLVEIDWEAEPDFINVTLHTREKTNTSSFENPIWSKGRIDSNLTSYHTVKIKKPMGQVMESVLIEIEQLMKNDQYDDAIQNLLKLDQNDDFVRKFLAECFIETESFQLALDNFSEPITDQEFIIVLNATIQLNNKPKMIEMSAKAKAYSPSNPAINDLIRKIEAITI